jgi:CRP/FNR family transcriptional regulator, nitrogen oxide reductase regulator
MEFKIKMSTFQGFDMACTPNILPKIRPVTERSMTGSAGTVRAGSMAGLRERPQNSWATRVQYFTLFANISLEDRSLIVTHARERVFSRGQIIHVEGDDMRQVVLLTSGSAKMVQCSQNGSAVILRLCGPGELLETPGTSKQGRHRSTPQALSSSSALVWDSGVFESLSKRIPALKLNVSYILYKQLEDMEDRFREISTERVAPRLGRQISRLVKQVGIHSNGSVEINLTREELAQLVGTTLFTVSRFLSEWDRKGIVTTRREGFSVDNLKALSEVIDESGQTESERSYGAAASSQMASFR